MSKANDFINSTDDLLAELRGMITEARDHVSQAANAALTTLYWKIGQRIHHDILTEKRADYGKRIVASLGRHLTTEFGAGFGEENLRLQKCQIYVLIIGKEYGGYSGGKSASHHEYDLAQKNRLPTLVCIKGDSKTSLTAAGVNVLARGISSKSSGILPIATFPSYAISASCGGKARGAPLAIFLNLMGIKYPIIIRQSSDFSPGIVRSSTGIVMEVLECEYAEYRKEILATLSQQSSDEFDRGYRCTDALVRNWLRNRNTLEFPGIWEQFHIPGFNSVEFDGIRMQAGLNSFTLTPTQWIEKTGSIGVISKTGRYVGNYAHEDVVL